jgi:hypothetical protein
LHQDHEDNSSLLQLLYQPDDLMNATIFTYKHAQVQCHSVVCCWPSPVPYRLLNCFWSSPALSILISGTVGPHDHIFLLSKTFTCFEMGPTLRREERLTTAGRSPSSGGDSSGHSLAG